MSIAAAIAIQLELTTRSMPQVVPVDLNTAQVPRFWRGEDVYINVAIFDPSGLCVDLSNIDFLEFDLFPYPTPPKNVPTNYSYSPYTTLPFPSNPPAPLLFSTVPAVDITKLVTRQSWLADRTQQATFKLDWTRTLSLDLGGQKSMKFWFTVHGLTSAGRKLVYGGGQIEIFESGDQGIFLPNGIAPLVIPALTTLYIPENQQLTFTAPIDVVGNLDVEGDLVEVGDVVTLIKLAMPSMILTGDAVLNQLFGYFVAPVAGSITGVQVALQGAPVGADLICTLVDAAGTSLGKTFTVLAGQVVANVVFGSVLPLAAADVVQCKVTQVGSASPGSYINANLVFQ